MGDLPRPDWSGRLFTLFNDCLSCEFDALVVSNPVSVFWACGFKASAGLLVISSQPPSLIVDGRYLSAAREGVEGGELGPVKVQGVERRYDLTLALVLAGLGVRTVGFESDHLTVATLMTWERAAGNVKFVPGRQLVERRRAIKDPGEIRILREAARRASDVARHLGELVAPGRTEREVAAAIDRALDTAGFSQPAFPTIVASGPNSALPHARPTDRHLRSGDLVVLDFGGVLDGYFADLTRMAGIGHPGAQARAVFDAVRAAQGAALAAVRGGTEASEVDAAARRVLTDHGLGEAFLHATGHGLGLELHEAPRLARVDEDRVERLEPGMVCTIEPGAYVAGLGGARLEDDVLVTAEGCEVLTDAPRDLLVV